MFNIVPRANFEHLLEHLFVPEHSPEHFPKNVLYMFGTCSLFLPSSQSLYGGGIIMVMPAAVS